MEHLPSAPSSAFLSFSRYAFLPEQEGVFLRFSSVQLRSGRAISISVVSVRRRSKDRQN